jgi:hypothetical protein
MGQYGGPGGYKRTLDFEEYQGDVFAQTINQSFGDEMREVIYGVLTCQDVWAALANVRWIHENGDTAAYTLRAAGDLVASIRGDGDYLDWYCGCPYPRVTPYIAELMTQAGWQPHIR